MNSWFRGTLVCGQQLLGHAIDVTAVRVRLSWCWGGHGQRHGLRSALRISAVFPPELPTEPVVIILFHCFTIRTFNVNLNLLPVPMHKLKVKKLFTAYKKLMIAESHSDLLSPFRFKTFYKPTSASGWLLDSLLFVNIRRFHINLLCNHLLLSHNVVWLLIMVG